MPDRNPPCDPANDCWIRVELTMSGINTTPARSSYDVVIIGGAVIGSSIAWFLTDNPDFQGRVLVVEMDPTYEFSSTARTNNG